VHHRLFVSALVIAQAIAHLVQRLADAGDVAVAEDAKHAGKEALPMSVALAVLDAQESHERLGHRQSNRRMQRVLPVKLQVPSAKLQTRSGGSSSSNNLTTTEGDWVCNL
jgi:hypothetical protein